MMRKALYMISAVLVGIGLICVYFGCAATMNSVSAAEQEIDKSANVEDFHVDINGQEQSAYVYLKGTGAGYDIYVNGILWYRENKSAELNSYHVMRTFDEMITGASYTFKLVLYDADGCVAVTKESKQTIPFSTYGKNAEITILSETYYDDMYQTTGYNVPNAIITYPLTDVQSEEYITYQVYRATGSAKAKFKKVGETAGKNLISYEDYDVKAGQVYYYKFRPVSDVDSLYIMNAVKGDFSPVVKAKVSLPKPEITLSYTDEGVGITISEYGFASSFKVYRSTKKNSGYQLIKETADTYYVDKSTKQGVTYYYKVRPVYYDVTEKSFIQGKASGAGKITTALGKLRINVAQSGVTSATITWNRVPGASAYDVYIKDEDDSAGIYRKIRQIKNTKVVVKKLDKAGNYQVIVKAVKKKKGAVECYVKDSTALVMGYKALSNLRVSGKSSKLGANGRSLTLYSKLTWDRVYGADGYIVQAFSYKKGRLVQVKKITNNKLTAYRLANVITANGEKYGYVRVAAYKGKNVGEYSYIYDITSLPEVTGVSVKRKNSRTARITWNQVSGANEYTVVRSAPTGNAVTIAVTDKNFCDDKNMTPGINYTYQVIASATGEICAENSQQVSTVYNHKLAKPVIKDIANISQQKVVITWKKQEYATEYVIYRATAKDGPYKQVGTISGKNSYTGSGLKNTTYYYKIKAICVNDAGIKMYSDVSKVKSVKITK
ncbi:MAG: hypothetical protein J6L77_10645 [Coprococcus sp.]|nr:hypothetical protein [Coprococcus sp.]